MEVDIITRKRNKKIAIEKGIGFELKPIRNKKSSRFFILRKDISDSIYEGRGLPGI